MTILGNTLSNISNGGLVCEYKSNNYFVNLYRGEDLYMECGKMYSQITDDKVKCVNILNDKIYYSTLMGELKVLDINGENNITLLNGPVDFVNVVDNYIYYINLLDNYGIYEMNTLNNQIRKISSSVADKINYSNGYIYYIKCSENLDWYGVGSIHKLNIESLDDTEIISDKVNNIVVDKNFIYYTAEEYNHKLFRINIETNKKECLIEDWAGSFNIYEEMIYYANISDEGKLYVYNIKEKTNRRISDDVPENINIAGEYMYFANAAYGYPYRLYKMKLNGTEKQML